MANNKHQSEELKGMATDAIIAKVTKDTVEYRKIKFNHTTTPLENPNVLKGMRRNIARLKTELRARKIAEQQ